MPPDPESLEFTRLIERIRAGDEGAVQELVSRYESDVRAIAGRRISPQMRPYLDTVDLVQSMHRSLLIGLRNDRFTIHSRQQLFALVVTIVRRKAARHWRKVKRQHRLSGRDTIGSPVVMDLVAAISRRELEPGEAVANQDSLEQTLNKIDPVYRDVIRLRLDGHSTIDACRILGLDPDVTRVQLSRIRRKLMSFGIDETTL